MLFRGIHSQHYLIKYAKMGLAIPHHVLNPAVLKVQQQEKPDSVWQMAVMHNDQIWPESPFTSWTPSFAVASFYACKYEPPGVVLVLDIEEKALNLISFRSPDEYEEGEVLLAGVIEASTIREPNCPGHATLFG
ncbi:MAG: hypothetical protein ACOCZ8_00975 [Bacteroidota bacterium]